MKHLYDPAKSGKMTIVCFVSGSGSNYARIAARDYGQKYIVFTNRPGCGGAVLAEQNRHEVIELSHAPYLNEAKKRCGPGNVPRNCAERAEYEKQICKLIESSLGGEADLICLAGYDQWLSDWMVDRYYPRILNVHPGDTTKGYDGLHWVPSAKAILARDETIRSTLFFVDKGEDTGPVLAQSRPLNIARTLTAADPSGMEELSRVTDFAKAHHIKTYDDFREQAGAELLDVMGNICRKLQDTLKETGDWEIYPFAVHDLIARGRVQLVDRAVHIDGRRLPEHGYRLDEPEPSI